MTLTLNVLPREYLSFGVPDMPQLIKIPPQSTHYEHCFEPLLDTEEAAALLKIHPKTLQRMARRGEISGIHIGKLWRFRASDLNEWINAKIA
jgi:excisionase family DNA binding protein